MSKFSHMILQHIERLKAFDMINVRQRLTIDPKPNCPERAIYAILNTDILSFDFVESSISGRFFL